MVRSRRFVSCATWAALAVAGAWVPAAGSAGEAASKPSPIPSAEAWIAKLKPGHPRLLIDAAGLRELQARMRSDRTLKQWDDRLRRDAERLLAAPLPRHVLPDGKRLLATSRSVLGRSYTLALGYRLHRDQRFAERLWREVETVAAFPDFNPKHFLDTAEMTHALAIAYDWLYDTWSESQRRTIREAIVRHGLKPGLAVYRQARGWVRAIHNWNQVCNGGMILGALAVADEEPKLASEILHGALASVPRAMASYAPDGAWPEGPGYWAYATEYNVVLIAALESALGSHFGLADSPGFSTTGLFPIYMTGPTGRAFNFEDSGERVGRSGMLFWLAERFDLPALAAFAVAQDPPPARAMIWYRHPGKDPAAAGLPLDKYWRGVEVVTLRSAWNDPQALFVGMQAGSNRVNHNHLDLGSFVLDGLGHRWAVDLGADDYNLPGYFGSQRYTYYRLRAEGHNTLVLNPGQGPDQDEGAVGRIRRFDSSPAKALAVADLTAAYAKHAQRVERGIAMRHRREILVQDEIEAAVPVELWWFMHTPASITISENGRRATLAQGEARLVAQLVAPETARFEVRPAEPLPSSPQPERQARNDRVRKLTIHLAGVTRQRLAVLFVPASERSDSETAPQLTPLPAW